MRPQLLRWDEEHIMKLKSYLVFVNLPDEALKHSPIHSK